MAAISWDRAPRQLHARPAVTAKVVEVAREVGRAAAALAGVVAWGTLLLLLLA